MKFLLQNNSIRIDITRLPMMLKIFLHHLICYVTRAPSSITNRPKVTTPIPFRQFWILFLQSTRCPSLQAFYNITYIQRRPILYMNVDVVFTNNTFQNFYILRITNLLNQVPATSLNITLQNFISIFCDPNYVSRKPRYRVTTNTLFFTHQVKLDNWVATESLALKAHSFY
jgi:hypothetical protein